MAPVFSVGSSFKVDTFCPALLQSSPLNLLGPDQRTLDLNIDAIRTITRAKVTRDSLTLVMSGYAKGLHFKINWKNQIGQILILRMVCLEVADSKGPQQRGLLDETQVQTTAQTILSSSEAHNRRLQALYSAQGLSTYQNVHFISICISIYLSIYLSIYTSIHLSIYLSIRNSIYQSIYRY